MPVLISGCDVGCGSAVGGEEGGGGQLGLGGAVTGAVEQGGGGQGGQGGMGRAIIFQF